MVISNPNPTPPRHSPARVSTRSGDCGARASETTVRLLGRSANGARARARSTPARPRARANANARTREMRVDVCYVCASNPSDARIAEAMDDERPSTSLERSIVAIERSRATRDTHALDDGHDAHASDVDEGNDGEYFLLIYFFRRATSTNARRRANGRGVGRTSVGRTPRPRTHRARA